MDILDRLKDVLPGCQPGQRDLLATAAREIESLRFELKAAREEIAIANEQIERKQEVLKQVASRAHAAISR